MNPPVTVAVLAGGRSGLRLGMSARWARASVGLSRSGFPWRMPIAER